MGRRGAAVVKLDAPKDAIAIIRSDGSKISYGELGQLIHWCANDLRAADLRAGEGQVVAIALADPTSFLIAALAAWECGAAVLPLDARSAASADSLEALAHPGRANLVVHALDLSPSPSARPQLQLTKRAASAIDPRCALLLFTSGSSGPPKGVLLGREGIRANVDAILRYLPLRAAPRTAILLPFTYSYALVGQALTGLRAGATLLLLGDLKYPALQLSTMARLGAQGLSSVPASLKLLARAQLESRGENRSAADLPVLDYVASAGAHLDRATIDLLHRAFPEARLFNQYGLTEASPRVAAIGDDHPAFARGAVGFPLEGIEVWAEDEEGRRLPSGASGAICVRGASVMLGYLEPAQTSSTALSSDGVLRTGDLGWIDSDGALFIEGRSDGVVKIAGERVGVESVAESLRTAPGAGLLAVVDIPDDALGARLICFFQGSIGALDAVRTLARTLPEARRPARIFQLESLPRTARGKIDLFALKTLALEKMREKRVRSGGVP